MSLVNQVHVVSRHTWLDGAIALHVYLALVVSRHTWLDVQIWFTDTQISSVPYKTPWKNHREGMILPVFVCMPVFVCAWMQCLPVLVMRDKISLDIN